MCLFYIQCTITRNIFKHVQSLTAFHELHFYCLVQATVISYLNSSLLSGVPAFTLILYSLYRDIAEVENRVFVSSECCIDDPLYWWSVLFRVKSSLWSIRHEDLFTPDLSDLISDCWSLCYAASATLISLCCSSDTLLLKTFTLFLLFDLLFPKISTFGIFHFNQDSAWVPLLWPYCAGSSAPIAVSFSPAFLTLYVIRLSSCLLLDLDCKFQKSFFHYCIP